MSDVKEKVEMELKPFETMCDATTEHLRQLITGSCEATADEILSVAKALGEIVDIKKDIVEMCYKKQIMTAMEENEDSYGEEWDENGLMGYSQPRSKTSGRYMRRGDGRRNYPSTVVYYTEPDAYRMNMDLYKMNPQELRDREKRLGVHYYTEPYTGIANDKVIGSKMTPANVMDGANSRASDWNEQPASKVDKAIRMYTEKQDMQSLEEMMDAIQEKIMEEAPKMDVNKKNMTKSKLTTMVNQIR